MSDIGRNNGLSLEEALLETIAPAMRREIERLRGYDSPITFLDESGDSPKWQFRRMWAAAVADFLEILRRGDLCAMGFVVGGAGGSSEIPIPADRWRILKPNFAENSAADAGSRFIGIRVFRNVPKEPQSRSDADPYRTGFPGRPTIAHLLVAELRRRAEAGLLAPNLAAQALALQEWASETHSTASTPNLKTIENCIRQLFWNLLGKSRRRTPKPMK